MQQRKVYATANYGKSRKYVKTLGKIKRFEFRMEFVLLRHDVHIIDDNTSFLILEQDWIDKYGIQEELSDNIIEPNELYTAFSKANYIIDDEDEIKDSEKQMDNIVKFEWIPNKKKKKKK